MGKSTIKQIDEAMAQELDRKLSEFTVTIKHVQKLYRLIRGFVFAYHKDGEIHYDTVELIWECNGRRIRHPKFVIHPTIQQRIAKHHYQRWFVYCDTTLYPLQTAKPSILEESFIFMVNDDVLYRTKTAYTEETFYIRKKPLLACRPLRSGWGVTLRQNHRREELLEAI